MINENMIPIDFTNAHEEVCKLCETFAANHDKFHESSYNESQVRKDFLDKFFIALGWDVNHDIQTNPYEQEVKVEKNVNVAARVKKADYAFYVKPNFRDERFFVEAKKPSVQLETPDNCFQTIRYAYSSSRAAVSLLTNFKEFYIIDCRFRPDINTAVNHVYKKYSFEDFKDKDKFAEVFFLFGREAVSDGSLEKFALNLPKPKGKVKQRKLFADGFRDLDDDFLAKLEEYRAELAKMFKRKNPQLTSEDLTEATQRTLDRLVFIRFLEDKLIEPSTILDKFGDKPHAWKQFVGKSKDFDKTYNGIIFKHHTIIDADSFETDDRVFLDICDDFASKYSPYHFNYIPIHILGSIYERFLGNVIEVTAKQAKVVPKPEVRKAGGVFYTPEYIVRYIVENTIGKMVEKKTPKEIAEMRFADIACGSGSFLLGVYDYLLRWHTRYYNQPNKKTEAKRDGCVAHEDGTFHLSFEQKREILTNNIYGTDIDRQAFEVTQLSLFLKLLEEETQGTKQQYLGGFRQALLPSLGNNIVCGNALVDWDVTGGDLFEQLDYEKERRLNPMSFSQKFPEVIRKGGFDAIVGNPPYIRIQILKETSPASVDYLKQKYLSTRKGNYDIYVAFVEKALSVLKEKGKLGYILPHKFFNAQYGEPLRKILADGKNLSHIVHFGDQQVFENATTYTCIFILSKEETKEFEFIKVENIPEWQANGSTTKGNISSDKVSSTEWNFAVGENAGLFEKLNQFSVKLSEITDIFVGLQTSADDVFILDFIAETETTLKLKSKSLNSEVEVEKDLFFPIISGVDVKTYNPLPSRQFILFPYDVSNNSVNIISLSDVSQNYPLTFDYLCRNKKRLEDREKGKLKGGNWHGYIYLKNMNRQSHNKICVPRLVERLHGTLDFDGSHFLDNVDVGGLTIKQGSDFADSDLKFLLALINSKLLGWYFPFVSAPFRGGFRSANKQFLSQLPIPALNLNNNPTDKARHDELVRLVDAILQAKQKLAEARNDGEREFYQNKCSVIERNIDDIVYDLYDLTAEERDLIENA